MNNKWDKKQARELFCKTVNTLLMNGQNIDVDEALKIAKKVVDKVMELYPPEDQNEGGEPVKELPDA